MTRARPAADGLVRLAYFSQNVIAQPAAGLRDEINAILRSAQRHNAWAGVTGALIFNRGAFGQIIEGSEDAVEETFERIQLDPRHDDITLLEIRPIRERSFATWAMGFCGREALLDRMFTDSRPLDVTRLNADAMVGLLHRLALAHELRHRAA